jgi:hypothetical protein
LTAKRKEPKREPSTVDRVPSEDHRSAGNTARFALEQSGSYLVFWLCEECRQPSVDPAGPRKFPRARCFDKCLLSSPFAKKSLRRSLTLGSTVRIVLFYRPPNRRTKRPAIRSTRLPQKRSRRPVSIAGPRAASKSIAENGGGDRLTLKLSSQSIRGRRLRVQRSCGFSDQSLVAWIAS